MYTSMHALYTRALNYDGIHCDVVLGDKICPKKISFSHEVERTSMNMKNVWVYGGRAKMYHNNCS